MSHESDFVTFQYSNTLQGFFQRCCRHMNLSHGKIDIKIHSTLILLVLGAGNLKTDDFFILKSLFERHMVYFITSYLWLKDG